ncbi:hypothetical protein [Spirosoma knui]
MRKLFLIAGLYVVTFPVFAQQVKLADLLHYLQSPVDEFELRMLQKGFVCYQNKGNVWGWTCLFAYQPIPLFTPPDRALAIIQYDRNNGSDIIVYQVQSSEQYRQLRNDLLRSGYRTEPSPSDRCVFSRKNIVITCQQTNQYTGISGNYTGHSVTLVRRRS